ncbi:MAG TPA: 3-isopropylmalate dehydratase large subunit [Deltaproteobacteria bacterium]|nr:3-isopropylmalate dehydratase large subunit [Deltaproteobacteria bacterium]HQI01925.1 3-isopropylmalate dehydratase large subunit [Deltaproteobacteria bacterium]HQJ08649.1 3-isopropylmalate dehydratase large subunit [Deltaproteobacteria bacterium]
MTLAERILARASGRKKVSPGEYVTAEIDKVMAHEAFAAVYMNLAAAGIRKIWDPDRVFVILDHYIPASTPRAASIHQLVRAGAKQYGIMNIYRENEGIAHQVMMEKGNVLPGELVLGTDSHTCTYGALAAASCGIGISEMTYVFATGRLWFQVPETIRFILTGELAFPLTSKDVILKLAGEYSAEVAQYKSIEFSGPAAEKMDMSSRMTMTNMSVELGAKFSFFSVDEKTVDYLKGRTDSRISLLESDDKGSACQTYEVCLDDLEPQVAKPHSVDNVVPVSELKGTVIHQALLGSCTNGRLDDLHLAAELIKGKTVHPDVRLLVIPASKEVYRSALEDGTLAVLLDAGGLILNPGCGPCFGAHMGLLAPGEKCISSTNRNFKGRMGSDQAEVFLASPATVIASAIQGCIADPRDM